MTRPLKHSVSYHRKMVALSMFILVLSFIVIPLGAYLYSEASEAAVAQEQTNPRANYWRSVREGSEGYTSVKGQETNVLIQHGGQNWRQIRNNWLIPFGSYVLLAVIGIFVLYFLIKGRIRIEGGRSGREIVRMTSTERWVHWFTAVVFVVLALTGLILMFGKHVLLPWMGPQPFAALADASVVIHNYTGLLFILATILMVFTYFKDSLFDKRDIEWIKKAGGYLGGEHPKSGKLNAGQKIWYWTAALGGIALCISGIVLVFPGLDQTRETMQLVNIVHVIASVIVIAFFFVHLYLASFGVEGAIDAMTSGKVDENWAKQHHELWYEEVKAQGLIQDKEIPARSGEVTGGQPTT